MRLSLAVAASALLSACSGGEHASLCNGATSLKVWSGDTYVDIACKGPNGCDAGSCDTSGNTLNDGCLKPGELRCDPVTGTQVLLCETMKLSLYRTCSGPRTCYTDPTFDAGTVGCDFTAGDKCPQSYEGRFACDTVDDTGVLTCSDGGAIYYEHCMGGTCQQDGGSLVCQ